MSEFKETEITVDEATEAKMFAKSVELKLLKAPATAKFCDLSEMTAIKTNDIYTVSGYVDSQNSYGAMIRTPFMLRVTKGAEGWKSVDKFVSTQAAVGKTVAKNMILYWIIGIILSLVTFAIIYAVTKAQLGF